MSPYADRSMSCRDCGKTFIFTAGEQEFYATRGFNNPTRCSECRAARKAGRDFGSDSGGGYDRPRSYSSDSGRGGYGSTGGTGGFGSRSGSVSRQRYSAVCADCGAETEVPFEPRQGRPVYCRDCFEKRNPRR